MNDLQIMMIIEYMTNTLDRYEKKLVMIKNERFFIGYRPEDYYELVTLKVQIECLREHFKVIRDLIEIYKND